MKRHDIKQTYVLIGGFSLSEPSQYSGKSVTLNIGNRHGESLVKVLKSFPSGTPYAVVLESAKKLAIEHNCRLGRKFNKAEWNGEVLAVGDYVPDSET